jgi:spermidine/putrescine transport system substrate-binding protein
MTARTSLAAAAAVIALIAASPAFAAGKLVISNWDGYMPKDLPEKFKAETGIDLEVAVHATNEEIMGKVVASNGKGFDVLFVSSPFAEALSKLGIAGKIDHAKIPNLANLYPEASQLKHDPGNTFSVPYTWGTTGLCFRSDLVADAPTSWNAILKPADALKGKTTMLATDRWLMAPALLSLGMSVNETDPAKLDQAKQVLIDAKKTLLAYDDTTFYSKLVSGEAQMVVAWDGWCNYGIAENDKIKYVIPKEGSDLWVDTIVVVANSENQDAAHTFINYILKPETGKWAVENIMYKVPNKAAMEQVDKAMLEKYPNLAIAPADLMKFEQLRDLGDGMKAFSKTVTEVMSAK